MPIRTTSTSASEKSGYAHEIGISYFSIRSSRDKRYVNVRCVVARQKSGEAMSRTRGVISLLNVRGAA